MSLCCNENYYLPISWLVWFMVFNATFNNISIIVAVSFIGGENHQPVANHWLTLSLNVVSSRSRLCRMLVVIGTDCICSFNPTTIRSRLWWHRLFYIIKQRFEQKITCNIQYLESKGSLLVVCCNTFLFFTCTIVQETYHSAMCFTYCIINSDM